MRTALVLLILSLLASPAHAFSLTESARVERLATGSRWLLVGRNVQRP